MNLFAMSKDVGLYFGPMTDNAMHKHFAVQVIISLNGKFSITSSSGLTELEVVVLPSNYKHKLLATDESTLMLLLDPLSVTGQVALNNKHFVITSEMKRQICWVMNESLTHKSAKKTVEQILMVLKLDTDNPKVIDHRIKLVLEYVKRSSSDKQNIKELSSLASLSESRLQHLFKESIGIPLTQYIKWERIKAAIKAIQGSESLTESSYSAGFSDSAHLSRTFKEMFGIKPSEILKNSRNVQVLIS